MPPRKNGECFFFVDPESSGCGSINMVDMQCIAWIIWSWKLEEKNKFVEFEASSGPKSGPLLTIIHSWFCHKVNDWYADSGSTIYPQSWADSMVTSISKSSEFHQLPYGPWGFRFLPFLVWNLTRHLRSFEFDLRLVATYLPKKIQPKNMTWRMLNEKTWWKKSISKKCLTEAPQDTTIKHWFAWDCCLCSIGTLHK